MLLISCSLCFPVDVAYAELLAFASTPSAAVIVKRFTHEHHQKAGRLDARKATLQLTAAYANPVNANSNTQLDKLVAARF